LLVDEAKKRGFWFKMLQNKVLPLLGRPVTTLNFIINETRKPPMLVVGEELPLLLS